MAQWWRTHHPDAFILRRLSGGLVVKNPPPRCIHFNKVIRWLSDEEPTTQCRRYKRLRFSGLIPGWERSPGGGNSNPLQYSSLENLLDRGACSDYSPWDHKESYKIEHIHTHTAPDNCILLPVLSSWSVYILKCISSVSSLSRVWFFVTPWTVAPQASLPITNSQGLLKLMSIELVMPSNRLILCRPLLLLPSIFSSIRVFSNESVLHIRWSKYWSFSFSTSPSNEYSALISFRMNWLHLLAVQGTLKSLLQHHSSKALILWCSWNAWLWNG